MPADPFPYGSYATPKDVRHGAVADDVQLGQDELGDVDPDWSPSKRPQPKVAAVAMAAALSTVIIGVLSMAGLEVSETMAVALTALLTTAAGYLRTE